MKNIPTIFAVCALVALSVIAGAVPRETGKLYLVVDKSNQHVIQMGISPDSVVVQNAVTQELIRIDGEKPTHRSERYFKLIDGKLVAMTAGEMAVVDSKQLSDVQDAEVVRLKAIMARDPAGFRTVLGL